MSVSNMSARNWTPLLRWLLRTIAVVVPVFLVASFVTFALRDLSGLNPSGEILGENATP